MEEEEEEEELKVVAREVPEGREKRAISRYCKKYVGLRLVVEGNDENDSWHKVSL